MTTQKKILLHACCGPCASACVPRLKKLGRDVTLLFANSNIDTREEFDKRRREAEKLAAAEGVPLVTLPYDHADWLREVAAGYEREPEQGARCERCFRYNLRRAAAYAAAHGLDEFTTSLTVSPHKNSRTIFAVGTSIDPATFLPEDFKKREGFKLSVRRAAELGLYRQSYCGCEFSKLPRWRLHHQAETVSTNLDAREGRHGDVYTADFQFAGRGRLDHKWLSPPGANVMMSAVLAVDGLPPEQIATLPLVIGLAVARATAPFVGTSAHAPQVKWPNDVLVDGRKLSGILCERNGDFVIAGIGINVGQRAFDPAIADRATSLALLADASSAAAPTRDTVRNVVLWEIGWWYNVWKERGFVAVLPELKPLDYLQDKSVAIRQTDNDRAPVAGICRGIQADGSLKIGETKVYAGEAHVTTAVDAIVSNASNLPDLNDANLRRGIAAAVPPC